MTRAEAKSRVAELGGQTKSSVTEDLDYLVVADDADTKGSKITTAVKLIAAGATLQIISETTFSRLQRR